MARITKQEMINNLQAEVDALKAALANNKPKEAEKAVAMSVTDFVAKLDWKLDEAQLNWLKEKERSGDFLVTVFQGVTSAAFHKGWMAKGSKNAQAANRIIVMARKAASEARVRNGFHRDHAWFRL